MMDIADLGWSTIFVWLSRRLPDRGSADAVVTFLEEMSGDPNPIPPQYRVVRGNGEMVASGKVDRDHLALVPTSEDGTY